MTAHPEYTPGAELASDAAVRHLYASTDARLRQFGKYQLDDSDIHGTHMGLPVTDVPPRFYTVVSQAEVDRLSPRAAEVLGLAGPLEITFWEACYIRTETGVLDYQIPNCVYDIQHGPESPYRKTSLIIDLMEAGRLRTWRWSETRQGRGQPDKPLSREDLVEQMLMEHRLEEMTGINRFTVDECAVLQEIIDGLGQTNAD